MSAVLLLMFATATVGAQSVIQGYYSDMSLERGRVVALSKTDKNKVEPAPAKELQRMFGVVVDPNDAPVNLTEEGQRVFVATTGRYQVLVSSENGPIVVGDYLSMSLTDGIAAKATDAQSQVLGRAITAFDGRTGAITAEPGGAAIARITVDVAAAKNPFYKAGSSLPTVLRKVVEVVAGKPVNPIRVYTAIAIFFVCAIISAVILYGGTRSSIISIGRNPLSKKYIMRGLIQVIFVGIAIFIAGIIGVYLLLRL